MIITIVIPCHNQDDIVNLNIKILNEQSKKPDYILVIDDHSTIFTVKETNNIKVFHLEKKGRVHNRNFGIQKALELNSDIIIFMDGDSIPSDENYIYNYLKNDLQTPLMIFGMRKHINRPIILKDFNYDFNYDSIKIDKYPSDLLTANLDKNENFDNSDLRIVSGIYPNFNNIKDFNEKANNISYGLVTWSCNFMMTKDAAIKLLDFMKNTYNIDGCFDYNQFGDSWGGEDNAFGLDAHFAGINILVTNDSVVLHFIHERTDRLNTHVRLNNILIKRLINLYKKEGKYI